MWIVSEYKGGIPDINHFVPLLDRPCDVSDIIDCDSNSPFSATDIQPSTSGSNVSDCEEGCATDSDCSISVGDPCSDSVPLNDQLLTPIVGTPLPSGKHLPFAECVKTLLAPDNLTVLPAVPSGVKSNTYFVVSMHDNNERSQRGQRRVFHDDCGAWGNTRGSSSVVIGNNFKELFEKDGLVCDRKQVEGKQRYVPLPTQPEFCTHACVPCIL